MSVASAASIVGTQKAAERQAPAPAPMRRARSEPQRSVASAAAEPAYYDPQQEKLIGETETRTRLKQAQLDELSAEQKAELLELTHAQQMREAKFAEQIAPMIQEGKIGELKAMLQQQKLDTLRTVGAAAEVSPDYAQFLLNHNARSLTGAKDTNVKVEVKDGKMSFFEDKPVVFTDPETGAITQKNERVPYQGIRNVDLGKLKTMGAGVKEWVSAGSGKIFHPTTGEVKGGDDTAEVQLPSGAKVPVSRKTGQPLVNISPTGEVTPGPGVAGTASGGALAPQGATISPQAGVGTGVPPAGAPAAPGALQPTAPARVDVRTKEELMALPPGTPFRYLGSSVPRTGVVPKATNLPQSQQLGVPADAAGIANAAAARSILSGQQP